ncbi:hypothetical protein An04g00320 [Aspergillus niger]|uniref:Uncharacterized protein n=2 Tax=Aspergillus niger TaxID=5061 RepID=A2QHL7_ASPNC|nr:hypothetical protein An04g00320 [Aspergillus niger]CAK38487.1 hypothetical protein An04g00320 [Aspergillus niger]
MRVVDSHTAVHAMLIYQTLNSLADHLQKDIAQPNQASLGGQLIWTLMVALARRREGPQLATSQGLSGLVPHDRASGGRTAVHGAVQPWLVSPIKGASGTSRPPTVLNLDGSVAPQRTSHFKPRGPMMRMLLGQGLAGVPASDGFTPTERRVSVTAENESVAANAKKVDQHSWSGTERSQIQIGLLRFNRNHDLKALARPAIGRKKLPLEARRSQSKFRSEKLDLSSRSAFVLDEISLLYTVGLPVLTHATERKSDTAR